MQIIDHELLATVCGGNTNPPSDGQPAKPPPRTWSQVAADYTQACVQNATTAAIFQGRPASLQQLAVTAAVGCGMGLAGRAAQDWAERGAR